MAIEKTLGATLSKGVGSPLVYTAIAKVTSIGEVAFEADEIETTTLDNTDNYRTYMQGLIDAGELEIEGNFDKADTTQSPLLTDLNSGAVNKYKITGTSGWSLVFDGFVKKFGLGEKTAEGLQTFSSTLRLSGKPTYAAGA